MEELGLGKIVSLEVVVYSSKELVWARNALSAWDKE
jgi:hypothetical protein